MRVVKTIDLRFLDDQIEEVELEAFKLKRLVQSKDTLFDVTINGLKHELTSVYSLFGAHKSRRAANFMGSGLKYLFGVMDNNDRDYVEKVLNDIVKQQDNVHDSMKEMVHVMANMSKQARNLRQNQVNQLENFRILKKSLDNEVNSARRFREESSIKALELNLNNLLLAVQVQIDKVKNAILFLKAGVIDPYFMDFFDMHPIISIPSLNYDIKEGNFDTLIKNSNLMAVGNTSERQIQLILRVPVAQKQSYQLFENLVIPKLVGKDVVLADGIKQYLAVSDDNKYYFEFNGNIVCFKAYSVMICKNRVVMNIGMHVSCAIDMFFHNNDTHCQYKKLLDDFEVHNEWDNGLVVFSSIDMSVNLNCENFNESIILKGAFILEPPKNCSVKSNNFKFLNNNRVLASKTLHNKIPQVMCCSKFYSNTNQSELNVKVVLKSMKEIQNLNFESITKDLANWKSVGKIEFNKKVVAWNIGSLGFIAILALTFVVYKYCQKRAQTSNNVTVVFNKDEEKVEANWKNGKSIFEN